jgi:hypothetical protein
VRAKGGAIPRPIAGSAERLAEMACRRQPLVGAGTTAARGPYRNPPPLGRVETAAIRGFDDGVKV